MSLQILDIPLATRRYQRDHSYAATRSPRDKSSRICVRVNCNGERTHGKCFQCWIPENCQVRPKSKIIINVEPNEKSFKIKSITVQPALPSAVERDLEGLTPLRFVFKCESTIIDNIPNEAQVQEQPQKDSLSVHAVSCDTFIKTTHLSLIINHEYQRKRKGGGLLIFYLKRRGDKIEVIAVDEEYLPNLDLEE